MRNLRARQRPLPRGKNFQIPAAKSDASMAFLGTDLSLHKFVYLIKSHRGPALETSQVVALWALTATQWPSVLLSGSFRLRLRSRLRWGLILRTRVCAPINDFRDGCCGMTL
jgi:hypothetical protein